MTDHLPKQRAIARRKKILLTTAACGSASSDTFHSFLGDHFDGPFNYFCDSLVIWRLDAIMIGNTVVLR